MNVLHLKETLLMNNVEFLEKSIIFEIFTIFTEFTILTKFKIYLLYYAPPVEK